MSFVFNDPACKARNLASGTPCGAQAQAAGNIYEKASNIAHSRKSGCAASLGAGRSKMPENRPSGRENGR